MRLVPRFCASFLAVAVVAPAQSATIESAEWIPGTGVKAALSTESVAVIDSAVSYGRVELSVTSPIGMKLVVAYGLDYDGTNWYEAGSARYLALSDEFISETRIDAETKRARVVLPMHSGLTFHPDLLSVQTLHVHVGASDAMVVTDLAVVGATASAAYGVQTTLPKYSIIPDLDSFRAGIVREGPISFVVMRDNDGPAETFALSYFGKPELLAAVAFPESVVMPAGQHVVEVTGTYAPLSTLNWSGRPGSLVVRATTSDGKIASETSMPFMGMLMAAASETPEVASKGWYDKCNPTTVPATQPPAGVPASDCGKCVGLWATPPCPQGLTTSGEYIWYNRYTCSGWGSCTVTTTTVSQVGSTVTVTTRSCTPQREGLGLLIPAHTDPFLARTGHQCCYSIAPSTTIAVYTLPNCT
jgi:hypothetical protein